MKRSPSPLGSIALLTFQALFIFLPMFILGKAINWPASLDLSPAEVLPLIIQSEEQVRLGYGLYLIWSLFFAATAVVIVRRVAPIGNFDTVSICAIGFGIASAIQRSTGITRWLSASLDLARDHSLATQLAPKQQAIEIAQATLNSYGGAIGEMLGVGLCTSIWLGCVGFLILTVNRLPTIFGWLALAIALITASPLLSYMGLLGEVSPSITVTAVNLWLLGVAVWLAIEYFREKKPASEQTASTEGTTK